MALSAKLKFGDNSIGRYSKEYEVADCRILFDRPYNGHRPEGAARCQRVEVVLPSPGKDDNTLFEWFATRGVQTGCIEMSLPGESLTDDGQTQVLEFEDALCFSLAEHYDIGDSRRRMLRLGIMADRFSIDNVMFQHQ